MSCPKDHKPYPTRVAAAQAMVELIASARKTGQGGKSYKRLNVFKCDTHWHVGRKNQPHVPPKSAVRKENLPTHSEARRKLKRLDEQVARVEAYCIRKRVEIANKLVALDKQLGWLD